MKFLSYFYSLFFLPIFQSRIIKEQMITMKDGVSLHNTILFPDKRQAPTILTRSPYGYRDLEIWSDFYGLFGFVVIGQDWRGTGKSLGHFSNFHQEGSDGKETIEWIQKQHWYNGEIYTVGASADGMAAFLMARENIPINGSLYVLSTGIGYEMFYPGGAYRKGLIDNWVDETVHTEDVENTLSAMRNHDTFDEWWKDIDIRGFYQNIHYPTVFYSGWYDILLMGSIITFDGYQKESLSANSHYMVIDPCGHCQKVADYYSSDLVEGRRIIALFLNLYQFGILKKVRRKPNAITFYIMTHNETQDGDIGGYFTSLNEWPEYKMTNFYLTEQNTMISDIPRLFEKSLIHNPLSPSPTVGGANYEIECGPLNQSPLFERKDVLVFSTPSLTEPILVTGPVFFNSIVSSNSTSFDVTVRMTDFYKKESRLIQDGIVHLTSGEKQNISLSLWNTSYVFNKNHQIQIILSLSNYPRFNNSQEFSNVTFSQMSLQLPLVNQNQLPPFSFMELEKEMKSNLKDYNLIKKKFLV